MTDLDLFVLIPRFGVEWPCLLALATGLSSSYVVLRSCYRLTLIQADTLVSALILSIIAFYLIFLFASSSFSSSKWHAMRSTLNLC